MNLIDLPLPDRRTTVLWRVLLLLAIVLPPLINGLLDVAGARHVLATEAWAQAATASRFIAREPAHWRLSSERLEYQFRQLHRGGRSLSLQGADGEALIRIGETPLWPVLRHVEPVRANGETVAMLALSGSMRPALFGSLWVGVASLLFSLVVVRFLRAHFFRLGARLLDVENRYGMVVTHAADGIMIVDGESHRLLSHNHSAAQMLDPAQAPGLTVSALRRLLRVLGELPDGLRAKLDHEVQIDNGQRGTLDLQVVVQRVAAPGGSYLLFLLKDIGKRKQAESQLREAYRALSARQHQLARQFRLTDAIVSAAVDGIAVCQSGEGRAAGLPVFKVWNPAMTGICGVSLEAVNRAGWLSLAVADERAAQAARLRRMFAGEHLAGEEWMIVSGDGTVRCLKVFSCAIDTGEHALGEGGDVLWVLRDFTREKAYAEEIASLNRGLEARIAERTGELLTTQTALETMNASLKETVDSQVDQLRQKDFLLIEQSRHAAMGEMIGNIAHQWRQPLSGLGLVLQNLRYDFLDGRLDVAGLDEYSGRAMAAIGRMSTTIDDFRDFFKPRCRREAFQAADSIRESYRLLDASLMSAQIEVRLSLDESIRLDGYSNEFSQIIVNLIGNAKDALIARAVCPAWIEIGLSRRGERACVVVADNAGGIPDAVRDKVFDPYFTTKESGTGIGLYMARTIIEQHMGGEIAVVNDAHGAIFTVCLPESRALDTNMGAGEGRDGES